jgi:Fe-S-cluster containining protein
VEALKRWFESRLAPRKATRPSREVRCLCCGRCCEAFGGHLQASKEDLARWRASGRDDLLARVSAIGWIWIDPATGLLEDRCPFLVRTGPDAASCSIHEVKPDICREYPTLAHGRRCLRGVFLHGS